MKELRVLLVCGSGASSGFMAANIRKAAEKKGLKISVKARSESEIENYIEDIDLLLVGPHLSYLINDLEEIARPYEVSVMLIPKELYGSLNGEGVLGFIYENIEEEN